MRWYEVPLNTEEGRAEIRREIVLRLGYRIVDLNDNATGLRVKGAHIVLYDPSGKEIERGWTEDNLFYFARIPHYPTDLEAAATLQHPNSIVNVRRWADGHVEVTCECLFLGQTFTWQYGGTEAWAEALSRCCMWLLLDDKRKAVK